MSEDAAYELVLTPAARRALAEQLPKAVTLQSLTFSPRRWWLNLVGLGSRCGATLPGSGRPAAGPTEFFTVSARIRGRSSCFVLSIALMPRSQPSTVWEAFHPHTSPEPLRPFEITLLDLTLLPSATRFSAGEELVLQLTDRSPLKANQLTGQFPAIYQHSRRQRWSIHTGTTEQATMTIPVWHQQT